MNLNDLKSFLRVAELGTISAAGAAEGVPKSTISRRVSRLEDALGIELLRRSARSFTLTDDGRTLYNRSSGALRELTAAAASLVETSDAPKGRLVLTAPHDLGCSPPIVDLIVDYRRRYPAVDLEFRLADRLVDLVAEGVDIGLRAHLAPIVPADASLMSMSLGSFELGLYASEAFVKQHDTPTHPSELAEHELISHAPMRGRSVEFSATDGRLETVQLPSTGVCSTSMDFVVGVVKRGLGCGLLPHFANNARTESGALVRLMPAWSVRTGNLTLLWPASRHLAPRVRAFVDLARQGLRGGKGVIA